MKVQMIFVLKHQIKITQKTPPPSKPSIISHFVDVGRTVLAPAANLVCRKIRILSTPDHTCHQAPRSVEFLAIRSSFAVSIASFRHPIQLLSGFGEIAICRNNIRRTKSRDFFLKMMLKSYAQQKRSSLKYYPASKRTLPRSNASRPPRNGQPCRRPEQPPGSNTRVCLNFVCMTFLQERRASWLNFVQLDSLLGLFAEAPRKKRSGKDEPHC